MVPKRKIAKYLTLPNMLTMSRLVLLPVFLLVVARAGDVTASFLAAGIFVVMAVSDSLDGFFARLTKSATTFGALFDPIADKIVIITTYLYLSAYINPVLPGLVIIVVLRDVMILTISSLMYLVIKVGGLHVNILGKTSTVMQMSFIVSLLVSSYLPGWFLTMHAILAFVFTVASGVGYLVISIKKLTRAF